MKITIPKPCHENWDLMTPTEKGRFCAVCSKVVRDFTECTDDEIISEISNSKDEICGNFNTNQLNRNLNFSFVNSFFTKFAVGFILTSAGLEKVSAQKTCDIKKDTLKEERIVGKVAPTKIDTTKKHQIILGGIQPFKEIKKPLYVLDGKIISENKFKKINQNSIESVNVLKGNSAIAIYGEKAKYGAIIITSKKK